jgi:retron-type reverse transcriptase
VVDRQTGSGQRPLGLPSWSDKLLGEVVRLLLEAYYEPQFSEHSHGYRPGRGCHTALREVAETWTGTSWFIEDDISQCFDRLDFRVMLDTLGEKIHDNRLIRLIGQLLAAGYLEDWVWNATLSGVPQGGVLSPCLSNIYLNRLDRFVETVLIAGYTRGVLRKHNPEYARVQRALARARRRGDHAELRALRKQLRSLPSLDPHDPGYRRLRYVRYADDILTRVHRTEGRSRGDQASPRPVPARGPQAGAVGDQDADHPRPHGGGEVPRL